jgi:hypothetical protein
MNSSFQGQLRWITRRVIDTQGLQSVCLWEFFFLDVHAPKLDGISDGWSPPYVWSTRPREVVTHGIRTKLTYVYNGSLYLSISMHQVSDGLSPPYGVRDNVKFFTHAIRAKLTYVINSDHKNNIDPLSASQLDTLNMHVHFQLRCSTNPLYIFYLVSHGHASGTGLCRDDEITDDNESNGE